MARGLSSKPVSVDIAMTSDERTRAAAGYRATLAHPSLVALEQTSLPYPTVRVYTGDERGCAREEVCSDCSDCVLTQRRRSVPCARVLTRISVSSQTRLKLPCTGQPFPTRPWPRSDTQSAAAHLCLVLYHHRHRDRRVPPTGHSRRSRRGIQVQVQGRFQTLSPVATRKPRLCASLTRVLPVAVSQSFYQAPARLRSNNP